MYSYIFGMANQPEMRDLTGNIKEGPENALETEETRTDLANDEFLSNIILSKFQFLFITG